MKLEHKLTLGASIALGAAGLCDLVGLFAALGASPSPGMTAALLLMAAICAVLVFGGETVKAKLLEIAEHNDALGALVARCGWVFFIGLSVCLSHVGLVAAERAIIAPVVAPLQARVTEARADADAIGRELGALRAQVAARVAAVDAEIARTPENYVRERELLRSRRDAIAAPERERELGATQADAARELALAESALGRAPRGFLSFSVTLFGVQIALAAWLIPIAVEYITALYGRLSMPRRREARAFSHVDVLTLEPAGLELIGDASLLRELGSKHASLASKCSWAARALEKTPKKVSAS